ncbi:MAG TPA: hypothetical protein VME46_05010 [Acidimicrobiales bacterium]|nr:hypothetical protein [Acidimicrobiales bacterium]
MSSLDSSPSPPSLHEYGAAVWLTWLSQTAAKDGTGTDGHSAVFQLWHALAGARSVASADAVIGSRYPWATNFPDFSLEDLDESDLSPAVTPYLFDQAYAHFPRDTPPTGLVPQTLDLGKVVEAIPSKGIPRLSSLFEYYSAINSKVKYVAFNFSQIRGQGADDIVVADTDKGWKRYNVTGGTLDFCLADTPVSGCYIMLDNHSTVGPPNVTGIFSINAVDHCGPCMVGNWTATNMVVSLGSAGAISSVAGGAGTEIDILPNGTATGYFSPGALLLAPKLRVKFNGTSKSHYGFAVESTATTGSFSVTPISSDVYFQVSVEVDGVWKQGPASPVDGSPTTAMYVCSGPDLDLTYGSMTSGGIAYQLVPSA